MSETPPVATAIPSKLDFAREVRADRLNLLWRITIIGAATLFWTILILTTLAAPVTIEFVIPSIVLAAACVLTGFLLRRNRYNQAIWVYTAGLLIALGIAMIVPPGKSGADLGLDLIAFALPIVILMVGLLMSPRDTFLIFLISVAMTIILPNIGHPFALGRAQVFSILLMGIATGVAIQTSGELYGIAQWALESYDKERKVKEQLFDSQLEVRRSYLRQKALADELKQINKELDAARAAALEAKNFRGQFLANMSHELRTPLNAIIGFSETMLNFPMMYDNQELPLAYKTDMSQVYQSGKHLLQIINDILDLSKVDAGRLEMELDEVELDPILGDVISTAEGLVGEKPVKLLRATPGPLPKVKADPLRLRQVILNLLSNAAKFTDQGSITVGAKPNSMNEVLFWVKDTGIGIPEQDLGKIFEEFRQGTSGRRKGRAGSGLGLAISRQLLNLMGGKIWVESQLSGGSTFYFTLPVYQPEPVNEGN